MKVLRVILKVLALVILMPFSLSSIGAFMSGDYFFAIIVLLFTGVPSFFLLRSFKNKKQVGNDISGRPSALKNPTLIEKVEEKKETDIRKANSDFSVSVSITKNETKENAPTMNLSFYKMQVKAKSKQMLESLEIISTTSMIDTLKGRIEFINSIYPDMIKASSLARYKADVQEGIELYKNMYYDRVLKDFELQLVLYPNLDDMKEFFAHSIASCYTRYVEKQKVEMSKLVRPSAIEKRREGLIRCGYDAKYMFKTYELPDNGNIDAIEQVRQQFYNHYYKKSNTKD